MVTLSLFRHAKSAWNNPGLSDFQRPLAPRGRKAAPRTGRYMEAEGLLPDLVLCSSAVRARETAELAFAACECKPEVVYSEALYMAEPRDMLNLVHGLDEDCAHAMLVGHNPGFHALALALAGSGDVDALAGMKTKFPTAALAVIDFEGGWDDLAPGAGVLRHFVVPRALGD